MFLLEERGVVVRETHGIAFAELAERLDVPLIDGSTESGDSEESRA